MLLMLFSANFTKVHLFTQSTDMQKKLEASTRNPASRFLSAAVALYLIVLHRDSIHFVAVDVNIKTQGEKQIFQKFFHICLSLDQCLVLVKNKEGM